MTPNRPPPTRPPFRIGDWLVEPDLDRISRGDEQRTLRPRATELLVALSRSGGELAPTRYLIDAVWGTEFVTVNALTQLVAELRRALGDDPKYPRHIETIPRRGYRLIAPTSPAEPSASESGEGIRFVLVDENDSEIELQPGTTVIGRSPDATVRVETSEVSRRHARIVVADHRATLEDLGSKNGTYLRGRRVTGVVELSNADEIQIGADLARFRVRVIDDRTKTEHSTS
ncbi:MAG: FHA domain-containing protein [Thermoanaerobaculales bacterium]|jgi:DNA-binding winged helix-turn-helix (wHTH) protein|nr:FHA domain-containing protein [Thermoanaerobaculales bacterium]